MGKSSPSTTRSTAGRSPRSGESDKKDFLTGSGKINLGYFISGGHRIYADAAYITEAPTFNQAFISPRTRNTVMPDLKTIKTLTADINYAYSNSGYDVRVTGFYTSIKDQTDVMSFYDDSQNSFTNFAMSGIDERHVGVELGFKVPTPVSNLSASGSVHLRPVHLHLQPYDVPDASTTALNMSPEPTE